MSIKEGLLLWSNQNDFSSSGKAFPVTAFTSDTVGWPIVLQMITFLSANMKRLGGTREAEIWLTSFVCVATADALNAFSFSPITGKCYCANRLVFEFDPVLDYGIFSTNVVKVFTGTAPALYYQSAIDMIEAPTSANLTGGALFTLINSFNPTRSITNAATASINQYLIIGTLTK